MCTILRPNDHISWGMSRVGCSATSSGHLVWIVYYLSSSYCNTRGHGFDIDFSSPVYIGRNVEKHRVDNVSKSFPRQIVHAVHIANWMISYQHYVLITYLHRSYNVGRHQVNVVSTSYFFLFTTSPSSTPHCWST